MEQFVQCPACGRDIPVWNPTGDGLRWRWLDGKCPHCGQWEDARPGKPTPVSKPGR